MNQFKRFMIETYGHTWVFRVNALAFYIMMLAVYMGDVFWRLNIFIGLLSLCMVAISQYGMRHPVIPESAPYDISSYESFGWMEDREIYAYAVLKYEDLMPILNSINSITLDERSEECLPCKQSEC